MMLTFLFEQYGYYPVNFKNNTFFINDWVFKLIEIEEDDVYVEKIDEYMVFVRNVFGGKGPFIIKTRFNKKISVYDGKRYVLVSVYRCDMCLNDLNAFHCSFLDDSKKINLNSLLETWKDRVSEIEIKCVNSLRIDSVYYKDNLECSMFCLGLSQNALQYLSEIIDDYGYNLENLTVVHKRLINLNSFDFFNPFNFVVDHPLKDLAELYKNDFLTFSELIDFFDYYKLDNKTASLFMARVLYPANVLDLLEDNIQKKEISFNLNYSIGKEFQKIKKVYLHLRQIYNIRPIDWLDV